MEKYINKHNENIELIKIIKRLSKEELRSYKKKGNKNIYMTS